MERISDEKLDALLEEAGKNKNISKEGNALANILLQEIKDRREDRQKYEVFTRLITTALGNIMHDEEDAENVVKNVKQQAGLEVSP